MLQLQHNAIMNKYLKILKENGLFKGMEDKEILSFLFRVNAPLKKYRKNAIIINEGDKPENIYIVLEGFILITKEDAKGNRIIIAKLGPPSMFAEAFAAAQVKSLVTVISENSSLVLEINFSALLKLSAAFPLTTLNLLKITAQKNVYLNSKLEHAGKKTIREKLLSYLFGEARRQNSATFDISLNRQELADYLFADRSALSRELSNMQKSRLIKYYKNRFTLLKKQ